MSAPVHYRVAAPAPRTHRYDLTLTVAAPTDEQELALPVWIPGSYLVREFSMHLSGLEATQDGHPVPLRQTAKNRWAAACRAGQPLELRYQVYAHDASVRSAWLDEQRGFFNPTSLCLRVVGQERGAHELQVVAPGHDAHWKLATALSPVETDARGFGRYRAADYDELADSPVEMGEFWEAGFTAGGVPHRFVVAGAPPGFDGEALARDTQRICEAVIGLWHPDGAAPPMERYLFMLNAVHDGYGGLEHRASTALICRRQDLPRVDAGLTRPDGYVTLLGLISHEYFHTWNVKRLRPAEFARYDYDRENETRLLWFFEGFTSYYDDLLLRRAGLIDDARYLKLLAKTLNQVQQTPGRAAQSLAQASFDAWTRYYRPQENSPNSTVSYYGKGALAALCLDLSLRAGSAGAQTLDDAMRALWHRCAAGARDADGEPIARPMSEGDLLAVLRELSGRDWQQELAAWVHGVGELPTRELLEAAGASVKIEHPPTLQRLGLRVAEEASGLRVQQVMAASPAEAAGLAPGDEWLAVNGWRILRSEDLPAYTVGGERCELLIARERRLLTLTLGWPKTAPGSHTAAHLADATWTLGVRDGAALERWLGPLAD